jgi:glucokinase
MTCDQSFVGLDVGATTMKAAVVADNGRLLTHPISVPTVPDRGQVYALQSMADAIRQAVGAASLTLDRIAAVGVATPGPMDISAGIMIDPPNMKPWKNVPVRQFIADTFQLPTAFQNDANAAAFGESWVGAGCGVRSMGLFTLGTGIGGGIVLEGRVLDGEHSHGGELGHIKIEMTNPRSCGCGQRGCLEAYASATAVVARTREALAARGAPSALRGVRELTAKVIFDAAEAGDRMAKTIVDDTARFLAIGASTVMHVFDPQMIVYAGGMTAAGDGFLERIRRHVRTVAFPIPAEKCVIRYGELGSNAGVIGAAGCARALVRAMCP